MSLPTGRAPELYPGAMVLRPIEELRQMGVPSFSPFGAGPDAVLSYERFRALGMESDIAPIYHSIPWWFQTDARRPHLYGVTDRAPVVYSCPLCCRREIECALECGHGWCRACSIALLSKHPPGSVISCPLCALEPAPTTKCQLCRRKKIGVSLACGHGWCDACCVRGFRALRSANIPFTCERCSFDKLKTHNTSTCCLFGSKRIEATSECTICMDRGAGVQLPCHHEFCEQCVSAFCGTDDTYGCPLCRQIIYNSLDEM